MSRELLALLGAVLFASISFAASGCVQELPILQPPAVAPDASTLPDEGRAPDAPVVDATRDAAPAQLLAPLIIYRFDEGAGDRVLDSSASGTLIHLRIANTANVTWLPDALRIDAPVLIASDAPPRELYDACKRANALSIEAWVRPAETVIGGTHRIISASASVSERNFLLGQGALSTEPAIDAFVLRVRTTQTDGNGLPMSSTGAGSAVVALQHVVAVRDGAGVVSVYIDGQLAHSETRAGDLSNWNAGYLLAVANEHGSSGGSRAWLGELHLVALYAQALTREQVSRHFAAGPKRTID